ncbi:MAG: rhomboid family intramembrane serine protease [Candidatus Roizmanbacteria bacterium]|nr:MAG: rhomboid family intramembrane serine protease [Candidatus Roizmanbacteria bacterium]
MFPLFDSTPRKHFPVINYLLILLNIVIFIYELLLPDPEDFIRSFAFIPGNFNLTVVESYFTIFTSLFIHGGFLHIISNMIFLHVFGDNIEDKLGHFRYILFYLGGGLIAALSQYAAATTSPIPMIGASGAISAVAGAYFILFRYSKVKTLIVILVFLTIVDLPAWFVLGYWFIAQIFSTIGSLSRETFSLGGIAWFAHIGGFIFGNTIAHWLREKRSRMV